MWQMELQAAQELLGPVLHRPGSVEDSRSYTKVLGISRRLIIIMIIKNKNLKSSGFLQRAGLSSPYRQTQPESRASHCPEARTNTHNIWVYTLTRIPHFASSQITEEWGLRVGFILKHNMKKGFHWQFPLANIETPCSGEFGPLLLNTPPREVVGLPYLTALWQILGCLVQLLLQTHRLWANYCPQDQ